MEDIAGWMMDKARLLFYDLWRDGGGRGIVGFVVADLQSAHRARLGEAWFIYRGLR